MSVCVTCGRMNADDARFCSSCGSVLATLPSDVRKTVTIVRCDVTGSTALGERLDPESLRHVMGRYFDEMARVIERHGGTVEKFIGDAVMAVFGIPVLHEDDALRAVRAAADMREALAALNDELRRDLSVLVEVRTGVTTGEVIAGDPSAGQAFVTGDAANTAARLESSAAPGEILVGDPTYRLVSDAVEVECIRPLRVKGKAEPLAAWRLLAVRPHAEALVRRLDAPMVGRTGELAVLRDEYEQVTADRSCRLVTILGEAGIGKSRLATELVETVRTQASVFSGRCLPYGEGITYWPLVEIVRQIAEGASEPRLRGLLSGEPEGALVAERVAAVVGGGEHVAGSDEIAWAVRKLMEHFARERPVLILLDDLQWGEATFLDLVEHLVHLSRSAPILLVGLARAGTRAASELLPDLGAALMEAGDLERASMILDEAVDHANTGGASLASIMRQTVAAQQNYDMPPEALSELDAAISAFESAGDQRGLARAWLLRGEMHNVLGEREQMGVAAARSAEHARRARDHRAEAEALRLFGGALVYEAERFLRDALAVYEAKDDVVSAARAQALLERLGTERPA